MKKSVKKKPKTKAITKPFPDLAHSPLKSIWGIFAMCPEHPSEPLGLICAMTDVGMVPLIAIQKEDADAMIKNARETAAKKQSPMAVLRFEFKEVVEVLESKKPAQSDLPPLGFGHEMRGSEMVH